MSDDAASEPSPPPPPPPGAAPAAPPPPPLGSTPVPPPPGYVGARGGPIGSVSLHRTRGLELTATILIAIAATIGVVVMVATLSAEGTANDFLAGDLDDEGFIEEVAPVLLVSFVQQLVVLAAAVIVMIWMYRVAANHRTLQRAPRWAPGWAIGGWFLPPLLYVIPFLMLSELWKASDPECPIGGDWRSGRTTPLAPTWFVLFSIVPLTLLVAQGGGAFGGLGASEEALAEQLTSDQWVTVVTAAVSVAAAIVFVLLMRGIGGRHRRLTGEDRV